MADPVTLDYVTDWIARTRSRLYTQFRNKISWEQWVQLLGAQFQDIEDAGQSLFTLLDIDNSEGANLDLIGRVIKQDRLGTDDPTYRLYLKARILANLSTGTPEDLYDVMRALYDTDATPRYYLGGNKQFELVVEKVITAVQAVVGVYFLGAAKEAAARGIFRWQQAGNAAMLTCGDAVVGPGTRLATAVSFGYYYFGVSSVSGFGASGATGYLVLDRDGPGEQLRGYRVMHAANALLAFQPTGANEYIPGIPVGAVVAIASGGWTGMGGTGLSNASDTTAGGELAGAAQA